MPTERIARALLEGPVELALERVFVGELGWERGSGAIAERGGLRLVTTGEGDIVATGNADAIELSWKKGSVVYRLPLHRKRPGAVSLAQLTWLKAASTVREGRGKTGLEECFDPKAIAVSFLRDYRALFATYELQLKTERGEAIPREEARTFLNRFLLRVMIVAFLQSKGWLELRGRRDYLQALYEDWFQHPGSHLFQQRLALVFFYALDEPRTAARKLLVDQIGEVPYIGGGIFSPEQFQKEFETERGLVVLPEPLFEDLFAPAGLLSRYEFSVRESAPSVAIVAVTPEVMGAALGAILEKEDAPLFEDTASHRRACSRVVNAQLGTADSTKLPEKRAELKAWAECLRGMNVFDGECGPGTYLVAALEELTEISDRVDEALKVETDRPTTKRRVATENLRGLDQNELAVQVARFRLALAMLASDEVPRPLPDLRQIIRRGDMLSASSALPPEGSVVEYKASFEWDPRRGVRSPEMRFGSQRTVVAFLNSEGGNLYIGVGDDGVPVGLDGDLSLIAGRATQDAFEARFRELLKGVMDPVPLNYVSMRFVEMQGKKVCIVSVRPRACVTYLSHKDRSGQEVESVFVRDGNRTVSLKGRARDAFVLSRSGAPR